MICKICNYEIRLVGSKLSQLEAAETRAHEMCLKVAKEFLADSKPLMHVCYLCGDPIQTKKKPYCHDVCALIEARQDDMAMEGDRG
jgi:hypothetical protein